MRAAQSKKKKAKQEQEASQAAVTKTTPPPNNSKVADWLDAADTTSQDVVKSTSHPDCPNSSVGLKDFTIDKSFGWRRFKPNE